MNSRCEFSETLVLDELMAPDADQSVRQVYKLFSVLGNSGALDVGEQVAYIRAHDSDWYRFADENVTQVLQDEAIEAQFGGTPPGNGGAIFFLSALECAQGSACQ